MVYVRKAKQTRANERNKSSVVAFSGYFDPLHVGHLEGIKLASKLADELVIILNTDEQCILKKGKSFMPEEERKKIMQSIKGVDRVVTSIDTDESVCKTLEALQPDIFAKGGDRFSDEIPEKQVCQELGIRLVDGLGAKIRSSRDFTGLGEE